MAPMRLDILTAERSLFEGEVDAVTAPGVEGELGVLPHHAALMTALQPGELRYRSGNEETQLAVTGGFMEVTANRVVVLADAAERVEEIDVARAEEAMRRAQQSISERAEDVDLDQALQSLRRARVRLDVARRRRRRGPGAPDREGQG